MAGSIEAMPFATSSFSQEGEDIYLLRTLNAKSEGFYVDVGAHHPFRFSNTYAFYQRGWRGINVEANPDAKALFDLHRSRDINLQCLVAETDGSDYRFDMYNEPALNSAILERRDGIVSSGYYKVEKTISLKSKRLSTILDEYLPSGQKIDFLSVDVEGLDLAVLRSNDWAKYRPDFVVAETFVDLDVVSGDPLYLFMKEQGYKLRSVLYMSVIFVPK